MLEDEGTRDGGGTTGAVGGWSCGSSRCGGCPGRDFCSSGTLVVRMTGSSLLVEEEVEGGVVVVEVVCCPHGGWSCGVVAGWQLWYV